MRTIAAFLSRSRRHLPAILLLLILACMLAIPTSGQGRPASAGSGAPSVREANGPLAAAEAQDDDEEAMGAEEPTQDEVRKAPRAIDPDETDDIAGESDVPERYELSPLPPIRNQRNLSSCGAYAFGYAMTSFIVNKANETDPTDEDNQVSPAFMYHVALEDAGATACTYTRASNYLDYLVTNGAASWAEEPYPGGASVDCSLIQALDTSAEPQHKKFQIGSWDQLSDGSDYEEIKEFIAADQPVVALYQIYRNFKQLKTGVWVPEGAKIGSHFMTVVGYDDAREYTDADGNVRHGALKVMNSWGTNFGDRGFAWIGYESHKSTCTYAFTAEAIENEPTSESGGALAPEGAHDITAQVTRAYQASGKRHVDLILEYQFSAPVMLDTVRVIAPGNHVMEDEGYDVAVRDGDVYFRRKDGKQFEAGTYKVEFAVRTMEKVEVTLRGTCKVAAEGNLPAGPPPEDVE